MKSSVSPITLPNDRASKDPSPSETQVSADKLARAPVPVNLNALLSATFHTAFLWDLTTDRIQWSDNAAHVFGLNMGQQIRLGKQLNLSIDPRHSEDRYKTIRQAIDNYNGEDQTYYSKYRFFPGGRKSEHAVWIYETGKIHFNSDGTANFATAILQKFDESSLKATFPARLFGYNEATGLNRERLGHLLQETIEDAKEHSKSCAFLMVALNNLSLINESLGFDIGDELIMKVGQRLRQFLRGEDHIGRYASNKFGVILVKCEAEEIEMAAKRLVDCIKETPFETSVGKLTVSCSIGCVVLPKMAATASQAVGYSLEALERAKSGVTGKFVNYVPSNSLNSIRRRNISVVEEMTSALQEDRLVLALQPIVDAKTHQTSSSECLLRIVRRDGSIISAGEYIAVAEQLGLSQAIDQHVQKLAVQLAMQYPEQNISLNVSGLSTSGTHWIETLEHFTRKDSDLLNRITVEITETAAIQDIDETCEFVDKLKYLGCRVAIDDFGAGYSSFKNLRNLKADIVKIDGSFVQNVLTNQDDRLFIETLVELARNSGMKSVAERVADERTAELLSAAGVNYLQGFYFGKPKIIPNSGNANPLLFK